MLTTRAQTRVFQHATRSSSRVHAEPPNTDFARAGLVIGVCTLLAGLCWVVLALDEHVDTRLWPEGLRVYLWALGLVGFALAVFTMAWMADLWWCWNRGHLSFVYWLFRPKPGVNYTDAPVIYAGETITAVGRIDGHRRDGRIHHRKVDWAKGAEMRVIRVTRPSRRMAVERRAKLAGSSWAQRHRLFWGGAEGFWGASGTQLAVDGFWIVVWRWGALCFPRHYGCGRPHRRSAP